jgi:NAD-dependent SIR2 family protein deacetylase
MGARRASKDDVASGDATTRPIEALDPTRPFMMIDTMGLWYERKPMSQPNNVATALQQAAEAIRTAEALLIGAGAGMGVDSGLPDFRGDEGFWNAYPPFRGRKFSHLSRPAWFDSDPAEAWGFYGHRLKLYRTKQPHEGFTLLRRWAESRPFGYFVFTSNVDGHFQKAGFAEDRIFECHGSIHHLQCARLCCSQIWPAEDISVAIDEEAFRALLPLPSCSRCGGVARPNIVLFDDLDCLPTRTAEQRRRYRDWFRPISGRRLVAIELGAGTTIPTVRIECMLLSSIVVRINPQDADVPAGQISIPLGALEAIKEIDGLLRASS